MRLIHKHIKNEHIKICIHLSEVGCQLKGHYIVLYCTLGFPSVQCKYVCHCDYRIFRGVFTELLSSNIFIATMNYAFFSDYHD